MDAGSDSAAFTTFLAATSATVFSSVYMWKIKPDLQRTGLICADHVVAQAADWVLVGLLLTCAVINGVCCFDKSSRTACMRASLNLLIPLGFCIAVTKAATLTSLHAPLCTIFELLWGMNFGVIMAMRYVEHREERRSLQPRGTSLPEAQTQVTKVMNELSRVAPYSADAADPDGDLETGRGDQCVICLIEWEADDDIRKTPCGHAFHEQCLRTWLIRQMCQLSMQTCAVCRHDLRRGTDAVAAADVRV